MTEKFTMPYHYFVCTKCDEDKKYHKFSELREHFKASHGVELDGQKGSREMVLHINKRPRHQSIYRWAFDNIPDVELLEHYG